MSGINLNKSERGKGNSNKNITGNRNKVKLKGTEVEELLQEVKFDKNGLVPAVLQHIESGEVLMVAYMNKKSLKKTFTDGRACFWSRSRQELWTKGATSGNYQYVKSISLDCDGDTLLVQVNPAGPACHTGEKTCFFNTVTAEKKEDFSFQQQAGFLKQLSQLIVSRKQNLPEDSYTTYLFEEGIDKIGKKVAEEAAEVIIAGKNEEEAEIVYESADLLYHLLVLLALNEVSLEKVLAELEERHKEEGN